MRSETPHGYGKYSNGCRCEVCKAAKAAYMAKRRRFGRGIAQRWTTHTPGRPALSEPGVGRYVAPVESHGTRFAYEEHGCCCLPCTDARAEHDRTRKARKRLQHAGP